MLASIASIAVIAALERVWPRHDGVDVFSDPQTPSDLAHAALVTFFGGPLGGLVASALLVLVLGDGNVAVVPWWPEGWPVAAQVLGAWLVYGFCDYWMHRTYHSVDALWWVHAVHHEVERMHVLKATRVHVIEGFVNAVLIGSVLLLLGVPKAALVLAIALTCFLNNLSHSNLDQRFWKPIHWLVPTVELHNIHHAVERSQHDTNLGIPLFDLAFGTYTAPTAGVRPEIGVANPRVPTTIKGQIAFPVRQWRESVLQRAG